MSKISLPILLAIFSVSCVSADDDIQTLDQLSDDLGSSMECEEMLSSGRGYNACHQQLVKLGDYNDPDWGTFVEFSGRYEIRMSVLDGQHAVLYSSLDDPGNGKVDPPIIGCISSASDDAYGGYVNDQDIAIPPSPARVMDRAGCAGQHNILILAQTSEVTATLTMAAESLIVPEVQCSADRIDSTFCDQNTINRCTAESEYENERYCENACIDDPETMTASCEGDTNETI